MSTSFTVKEHTDKYYNGFEFNTKDCTVILVKTFNPKTYVLDNFVCNNDAKKGLGRELLLNALKYVKEKDKAVEHITLASVPHTKKLTHGLSRAETKAHSQKKLNKYYGSLGFTPSTTVRAEENEFEGNLSDLIARIETIKGGKTKGVSPFQTPSKGVSPFQTPSKGVSPFQTPSKGASPFQTPSKGASPFQTPSKGASPFQTPSKNKTKGASPRKTRLNSTRRKASRKRGFALRRN